MGRRKRGRVIKLDEKKDQGREREGEREKTETLSLSFLLLSSILRVSPGERREGPYAADRSEEAMIDGKVWWEKREEEGEGGGGELSNSLRLNPHFKVPFHPPSEASFLLFSPRLTS